MQGNGKQVPWQITLVTNKGPEPKYTTPLSGWRTEDRSGRPKLPQTVAGVQVRQYM